MKSANMKGTSDIWFTTFLKLEGHNVKDFKVIGKNKGVFYFDIGEVEWKELKLKCDNSLIQKVKTIQCSIKDLLH